MRVGIMDSSKLGSVLVILHLLSAPLIRSQSQPGGGARQDERTPQTNFNAEHEPKTDAAVRSQNWWPKFRGDLLNTGSSASTAPRTSEVYWKRKIPGAREFWSSPTVFKDRVYIGNSNGNLYCLDARTGALFWTFSGNSFAIFSSPAVGDGMVFFGAADRHVYALPVEDPDLDGRISDDEIVWDFTVGPSTGGVNNVVPSSPAFKEGALFLGAIDQYFYCFEAASGKIIWKTYTPYRGQHAFSSSPAIYKGKVFAATGNQPGRESSGRLYCFNETSGKILWEFDIDDITYSSPVIDQDNDQVLIANSGDWIANAGNQTFRLYSLAVQGFQGDVDEGVADSHFGNSDLVWSYDTGRYVYSSPAIHRGHVYFGGSDGNLRCVAAKNGKGIWVYETPPRSSGILGSPAVADGMVFVGTADGRLVAVPETDPDGDGFISENEIVWSYYMGGKVVSSPAIAQGALYIGSQDGTVYCFRDSRRE